MSQIKTPRPLVSSHIRRAIEDYLSSYSILRDISRFFEEAGIQANANHVSKSSGQRRGLIEQYYASLDFYDPKDASRALRAFGFVLSDARRQNIQEFLKIRRLLEQDGYLFIDKEIRKGQKTISELTRRNIIESASFRWWGRLEEMEFLSRIYPLESLPSTDPRFANARGDIEQHRVCNFDWEDDYVFTDPRFDILEGPDEAFLQFFCETLHPVVRPDQEEVSALLSLYNKHLAFDGWEIVQYGEMSGRPLFAAQRIHHGLPNIVEGARSVTQSLNSAYIGNQITRMQVALTTDPELAIGTAKEFLETICKTILFEIQPRIDSSVDLPVLVRTTLKQLKLSPDDIPDTAKVSDTIRRLLQNLGTITGALAEIRNAYGSGHGKEASAKGLQARHARLAVGSATTLGVFMFETFEEHRKQ